MTTDLSLKSIGHIVLFGDIIGEDAFNSLIKGKANIYTSRTFHDEEAHEAGGFLPLPGWKELLRSLPPDPLIDVIAFSCTAATIALGNEVLINFIKEHRPTVEVTSPGIAVIEMMHAHKIKKIALLSPYGAPLHDPFIPYFKKYGIEIAADHSMFESHNLITDEDIGSVKPEELEAEIAHLTDGTGVEAIFISCAAFNTSPYLERLSTFAKMPVFSSTPSTVWHCLELAGQKEAARALAARCGLS